MGAVVVKKPHKQAGDTTPFWASQVLNPGSDSAWPEVDAARAKQVKNHKMNLPAFRAQHQEENPWKGMRPEVERPPP